MTAATAAPTELMVELAGALARPAASPVSDSPTRNQWGGHDFPLRGGGLLRTCREDRDGGVDMLVFKDARSLLLLAELSVTALPAEALARIASGLARGARS